MSLIDDVKANRAAKKAQLATLSERMATATASESRSMKTQFDAGVIELRGFDDRIEELQEQELRESAAAKHRVEIGGTGGARFYTSGPATYTDPRQNRGAPSYFKDLIYAQRGDANAADRLRTNNAENGQESRALGNTGAVGGSAGEFAPPLWLIDDFVKLARPARVFANLVHREPLPSGVSSVNIPKISGGTSTAIQTTQNTALSQTDLTTTSVSSGIVTIGGKQVVSQQLLDQSGGSGGSSFDRIIMQDLAADYAKQLDTQALSGSGAAGQLRGYLTPASTNVQTWTQAAPTAALFYSQLAKLQGAINGSRFVSPDTVVMHPRRWAWFASFTDSTGRPLVVPSAGGFNSMAEPGAPVAAGHVGSVLGMNVFTDANLSTTIGGTQDIVLMFVADDVWLWESDMRMEAFTQPYADSAAVLFRCLCYAASVPDRFLSSLGQITGTGLTTPVFAG